jgi:flagellar motor switch/type III secretory pathway protein FliN
MITEQSDQLLEHFEKCGDVIVEVRAELDRTAFTVLELLGLEPGSLLEFSRSTGENIDIYAGEVLLGWGEVLMMDGAMAVRLADLRNAGVPSLQADDSGETQGEVTNDDRKH